MYIYIFHVNMDYNLQPVYNELTLCVWHSIFFKQSEKGVLVPHFAESFCKKHSV